MRLNYIQEQQVIRSRELLGTDGTEHMEQQRDEGAAVQASRDSTGWMCQVRRQEKAQMDTRKLRWMDTKKLRWMDTRKLPRSCWKPGQRPHMQAGLQHSHTSGTEMGRAGMFEALFMEIFLQSLH